MEMITRFEAASDSLKSIANLRDMATPGLTAPFR